MNSFPTIANYHSRSFENEKPKTRLELKAIELNVSLQAMKIRGETRDAKYKESLKKG